LSTNFGFDFWAFYRVQTSYDTVLYPSYTHSQTHPDRLAAIGSLFGLNPTPSQRCRVLELGCGNGSNLLPMAWTLPESEFAGIDLASRPIASGQEMIDELGLKNVRLVNGNLTEINAEWGQFDYILAHGLYSWVPRDVQECLLNICQKQLSPNGMAFVSYNALPGCHLRNMVRDMMMFHVRGFESPDEKVRQSMALLRFLADAQDSRDEYRLWMKAELARIREHDEGHLFHDELADLNEPLYFTQFMQRATRHGLQYVGEADFYEMSDHIFNASTRQILAGLGRDRLLREQYLDFLKCRRFRQTLLCHQAARLNPEPLADRIAQFFIYSAAECTGGPLDLRPSVTCTFETPKGGKFDTDFDLGKAGLASLGTVWPRFLSFDDLFLQASDRLNAAGQGSVKPGEDPQTTRQRLCQFLLELFSAGIVEFRTSLPAMAHQVSPRPVASPVVRWQVQKGNVVTSLLHTAVNVEDEVGRFLLSQLDGTLNHEQLLDKLIALLKSRNAMIVTNGDESQARQEIGAQLEKNLVKLAQLGLLVG
jgi:methyltransferase-like protein/trans-aconitate methyltransferase